ncbi:hypothetical protein K466DRAFT_160232 [Polyporus arcularius HHB13444]|uniref:Uncharacterized protein n=1 Tax=Polyporus arcularius HHB13444 TaxID=1314778 RepID=A0A5C3P948_9APHY|nr:hypothetical protein K466DRAFT_160232 [Polyporus arcularius HHB13444]
MGAASGLPVADGVGVLGVGAGRWCVQDYQRACKDERRAANPPQLRFTQDERRRSDAIADVLEYSTAPQYVQYTTQYSARSPGDLPNSWGTRLSLSGSGYRMAWQMDILLLCQDGTEARDTNAGFLVPGHRPCVSLGARTSTTPHEDGTSRTRFAEPRLSDSRGASPCTGTWYLVLGAIPESSLGPRSKPCPCLR